MRGRWPLLVLLASALTFLASLYLPWQELGVGSGFASHGILRLLNLFASGGGSSADGWSTSAGVAASLAALALAGVAAIRLARGSLIGERLVAPIAFALCYLTIGSLVVLHAGELSAQGKHYRYAYGAYLGAASAAVALLVVPWIVKANTARLPRRVELLAALPGIGLLVSFLLPWAQEAGGPFGGVRLPGIDLPVVVLAAGGVFLLATPWMRAGRPLYAGAAIAVLTGGAVHGLASPTHVDYGAWLSLGFALALVAGVALARKGSLPAAPSLGGGLAAAAGVFVVALFLPWQEFCAPNGSSLGHGLGRCVAEAGWTIGESGAVAGTLAIVLIVAVAVAASSAASSAELTLAIAILTASGGATIADDSGFPGWHVSYGAYLAFVAAAILVLAALARIRLPRLESGGAIDRLTPLAASLACLCVVAFPLWGVLPERWSLQTDVLQGWYAMAGVLLTIHLLRRWLESAGGASPGAYELVLVPLLLLALTTLELVRERDLGLTWGGGILVGLCLLLTLFGWIERRGGLRRLEVPELLRVDRLPEPES